MDSTKNCIGILPSAAVIFIDVGKNVSLRGSPKALEEAKNLWCLRVTIGTCLTEESSQCAAFNECTMLCSDSEKA